MTKNMEEGYYGSATSLKSSSGHLQERKEWRAGTGNKNQRKQQPNLFVIEKFNQQSIRERNGNFYSSQPEDYNLRDSSQKALRTVLVRQVGKLVYCDFGKGGVCIQAHISADGCCYWFWCFCNYGKSKKLGS